MSCSVLIQISFDFYDSSIPTSTIPNFEILGVPNGVQYFVVTTLRQRENRLLFSSPSLPQQAGSCSLLHLLPQQAGSCSLLRLLPQLCDPQVSILLLRQCASFCKLSHLGRSISPCDSSLRQFMFFDEDVLHSLEECTAFQPSNKFNYHYGMVVFD